MKPCTPNASIALKEESTTTVADGSVKLLRSTSVSTLTVQLDHMCGVWEFWAAPEPSTQAGGPRTARTISSSSARSSRGRWRAFSQIQSIFSCAFKLPYSAATQARSTWLASWSVFVGCRHRADKSRQNSVRHAASVDLQRTLRTRGISSSSPRLGACDSLRWQAMFASTPTVTSVRRDASGCIAYFARTLPITLTAKFSTRNSACSRQVLKSHRMQPTSSRSFNSLWLGLLPSSSSSPPPSVLASFALCPPWLTPLPSLRSAMSVAVDPSEGRSRRRNEIMVEGSNSVVGSSAT
mmetsp:Transcript_12412/g.45243  ORF Transcript_12412/g.45243 Transcript_12412/m.45243 type:complete len:295 (+) Transcript_12412:2013-2897(+)